MNLAITGTLAPLHTFPAFPLQGSTGFPGKQNLYLFTLGDRQTDRAARERLLWSSFAASDFILRDSTTGEAARSDNDLQLRLAQPSVEVNGLVGRRLFYAVGLSQGRASGLVDNDARKDLYAKLRFKFGGLALDGTFDDGGAPVLGTGGQLFDRSLVVELFGYSGTHPVGDGAEDDHRTWGLQGGDQPRVDEVLGFGSTSLSSAPGERATQGLTLGRRVSHFRSPGDLFNSSQLLWCQLVAAFKIAWYGACSWEPQCRIMSRFSTRRGTSRPA